MTKLTAVIGHPVNHSLSPKIFAYWFKKYDIKDSEYSMLDVLPEDLESTLRSGKYVGFNITLPYKENAFNIADELTDLAKQVGAVNAITVKDGKLYGDNTDVYGVASSLKPLLKQNNTAVILGAGGASRAVCIAIKELGFSKIHLVNRTLEKAQAIAADIQGVTPTLWNDRDEVLSTTDVLINATSIGLKGESIDINIDKLTKHAVVADLVYRKQGTELIKIARENNLITLDGIHMLIRQAIPCFKKWYGIRPEMDKELIQHLIS